MSAQRVILVVHDDPAVREGLRVDLSDRYEGRLGILAAGSTDEASDLVAALTGGDRLALVIAGADLVRSVSDSVALAPHDPVVVVVRPQGDEAAAVAAVTTLHAARSVGVPWDRDRELYPIVDDVLDDWDAGHPTSVESVIMVGHRWARHAHELKDFLGRNRVPYRWLDVDHGRDAASTLERLQLRDAALPVVILPGGEVLADPDVVTVAAALGMHTHADTLFYELAIVGGGPAGLAAAVYGGSEGLSTLLIEAEAPGGQAGTSSRIENYLGFPAGISGADLARRALTQAEKFGVEVVAPQRAVELEVHEGYKTLGLADATTITCRALVIATGVSYRHLHTPGLERLAGAGVYYGAATTEAQAAEGESVFVIGSANSAGQGAMYFSKFADRVTILVKGNDLAEHMSRYLVDQIEAAPNIDVQTRSHVVEAIGDDHLEALRIERLATGAVEEVDASFLFVFVGADPRLEWLAGRVATDARGYVLAGPDLAVDGRPGHGWPLARDPFHLETSVPGVFVAGDARHGSIRRVAGAVGEGATCVQLVHRYLASAPA